jgi:hypothetical protein
LINLFEKLENIKLQIEIWIKGYFYYS